MLRIGDVVTSAWQLRERGQMFIITKYREDNSYACLVANINGSSLFKTSLEDDGFTVIEEAFRLGVFIW